MKRVVILILISHTLMAQKPVSFRFIISESSLYKNFTAKGYLPYQYGGSAMSAMSPGLDIEFKLKNMRFRDGSMSIRNIYGTSHKALLTGVSYAHHRFSVRGYNFDNDPIYSRMETKYIHVPLVYKYNFQLFLLNEDFHFGFGLGMMNSFLLRSHLSEEASDLSYDAQGRIVSETFMSDDQDVTKFSVRYFPSICFDMSISFRHLYIGERAFFNLQDVFMHDLEANWNVPRDFSVYLSAQQDWPKLQMGGGGFYIGWRF